MLSAMDSYKESISALGSKVNRIEKMMLGGGTRAGDSNEIIRKGLMGGKVQGNQGMIGMGWDGADHMGMFRSSDQFMATRQGSRQKAIGSGFGQLFQDTMVASSPQLFNAAGGYERVMKRMGSYGAQPVQKSNLAEGSGSLGGYTVPVQFYMELLRLMAEESFTRQLVTVLPMQSRSLLVPALLQSLAPPTGSSSFFGGIQGSWQPEGATINQTNPNFRQIELVARDLVFTCVASNQLLQDNAVALDTLLTTLFKEAMAWFFDYYVLQGSGANQPLGILNSPAVLKTGPNSGARTSTNKVIFDDVIYLYGKLLPSSYKTATWVCHPAVLYQLFRATEDATSGTPSGGLTFLPRYPSNNMGSMQVSWEPQILGLPLIVSEKLPNLGSPGDLMLVDFAKVLVGDRMAIQIEASPHILFQNNQLMWRVIQRWDSQPWLDKYITLADGSYTVSPYLALN
jgi:HK97 family phage major capsid protein